MDHIANRVTGVLHSPPACPNDTHRCKDTFLQSEQELHATVCPLRQFLCPNCFRWRGTAQAFKHHINKEACQKDSEYFKIFFTIMGFKLIESGDDLYIMVYKHDVRSGILWISLKYVGPPSYANRRYFELKLKHGIVQYKAKKGVEAAWNWGVNKSLAIMIDLKMLGFTPPVNYRKNIDVQVTVKARTPIFPKSLFPEILKDLNCQICNSFLDGDVIQANEGYSICKKCNVSTILVSRIRNRSLEFLSEILTKHLNTDTKDDITHELLGGVQCPVCLEYMSLPIRVCTYGHSVCGYCRPKLDKCPVCRQPFTLVRNKALESVCSKISYSCMYSNNGCKFVASTDTISVHESNCGYSFHDDVFSRASNLAFAIKSTEE